MVWPQDFISICIPYRWRNVKITTPQDSDKKPLDSGPTVESDGGGSTFNPKGDVKPTDANTVTEIKAYLDAHSISYSSSAAKADLLKLVG